MSRIHFFLPNTCFYLIWPITARAQALQIFDKTLRVDFNADVFLHKLPQPELGYMDLQEPPLRFEAMSAFLKEFERSKYMGIHFNGHLGKFSNLYFHWEATPHVVVLRVGYPYGLTFDGRRIYDDGDESDVALFFKEVERIALEHTVPYVFFEDAYKSEKFPTPAQLRMHNQRLEIDLSVLEYDGGLMDRLWVAAGALPPINYPLYFADTYSEHYACYMLIKPHWLEDVEKLGDYYIPYVPESGYPLSVPQNNPIQSYYIQHLQRFVSQELDLEDFWDEDQRFLFYRAPAYTVFENQLRFMVGIDKLIDNADYDSAEGLRELIRQAFRQHFGYDILDFKPLPHEIEVWRIKPTQ